jgi:aromatic-L-amino-acid/L-tryptophan decarboxylase
VFASPPSAERLHALLDAPLPEDGEPLEDVAAACDAVLASGRRTAPTFFGYVQSPATPVGVVADLLASAADQNVTAWRSAPAAVHVERLTLRWLGQLVGFDEAAAGVLASGGSAANLTALLAAVRTRAPRDADRRTLVVYVSEEAHFSVAKAAAALGLALRKVPVDDAWQLDPAALGELIADDARDGLTPVCVVASAGTTATGAVDPLDEVADIAGEHGLWFHVDGAYGAPAAAVSSQRERFRGMERADSLAIDAHKWLYVPVDCSALLVHDVAATARASRGTAGEYVRVLDADDDEAFAFWDHGLELSRRFRALELWMTLRFYGARRLVEAIEHDIAMATHLAALVQQSSDFELLSPPSLSICTFRHVPVGMHEDQLDAHNEELLAAAQRDGRVYVSNAAIGGRFALRACVTNFRTTTADIERTIDVLRDVASQALPTSREVAAPRHWRRPDPNTERRRWSRSAPHSVTVHVRSARTAYRSSRHRDGDPPPTDGTACRTSLSAWEASPEMSCWNRTRSTAPTNGTRRSAAPQVSKP